MPSKRKANPEPDTAPPRPKKKKTLAERQDALEEGLLEQGTQQKLLMQQQQQILDLLQQGPSTCANDNDKEQQSNNSSSDSESESEGEDMEKQVQVRLGKPKARPVYSGGLSVSSAVPNKVQKRIWKQQYVDFQDLITPHRQQQFASQMHTVPKGYCYAYNNQGQKCYTQQCRYKHSCSICGDRHPTYRHTRTTFGHNTQVRSRQSNFTHKPNYNSHTNQDKHIK